MCENVCLYEYFEDNENMHIKFTQVVADYLHFSKAMSLIEYAKPRQVLTLWGDTWLHQQAQ